VHESIVWAKLSALAEGARIASKQLWAKRSATSGKPKAKAAKMASSAPAKPKAKAAKAAARAKAKAKAKTGTKARAAKAKRR
jgi:5-methyltetrahydropteroyltriglutamate--homocysteine methyltransferase